VEPNNSQKIGYSPNFLPLSRKHVSNNFGETSLNESWMNPRCIGQASAAHSTRNTTPDRSALEIHSAHRGIVAWPLDFVEINQQLLKYLYRTSDMTRWTDKVNLPAVVTLQNHDTMIVRLRVRERTKWLVRELPRICHEPAQRAFRITHLLHPIVS
jgi:hypothetical protein